MYLHARRQPARVTDADGIWWCDNVRYPNSSAHVWFMLPSPEVVKRCSPPRAFWVLWRNSPPIPQGRVSSCNVIEFLEASAGVPPPRTPSVRTRARGRARQHRHVRFSGCGVELAPTRWHEEVADVMQNHPSYVLKANNTHVRACTSTISSDCLCNDDHKIQFGGRSETGAWTASNPPSRWGVTADARHHKRTVMGPLAALHTRALHTHTLTRAPMQQRTHMFPVCFI